MSGAHPSLTGLRVLAVEDEALVAMLLEVMLEDIGCEVIGVVGTVEQALAMIESSAPDAAVLDVNLGGKKAFAVADVLMERRVPFVFCTGYAESGLPERYQGRRVINKPYTREALAEALATAVGRSAR